MKKSKMSVRDGLSEMAFGAIAGAIAGPIYSMILLLLWNGIEKWLSIYPRFEPSDATVVFCCSAMAGARVRLWTVGEARDGKFS